MTSNLEVRSTPVLSRMARIPLYALISLGLCASATAESPQADWPAYNNTYDSQRFSPLTQITPANAADLKPACQIALGDDGLFQSGLIESDRTLYVTTAHTTVALDPSTCVERWRHVYTPEEDEVNPVSRGFAYMDGHLFRGTGDGRLLALDAKTGKELWKVRAGDPHQGEFFPAAPVAWSGLIFIGPAGGDWSIQGWMGAFDAKTGKQVWRFNTVPHDGEPGADTWKNRGSAKHGGGGTWAAYTLDTTNGELFVPVGNPAPDLDPGHRPGANLYTDSLVVLEAKTGKLKWYYQVHANDGFDYDQGAPPALYTDATGARRVALGSKDGHVYVLDRETHKLVFRTAVTTIFNADKVPTLTGVRACPGALGGVEWNGPAHDPLKRAIYVGAVDWCMVYQLGEGVPAAFKGDGQIWYGTNINMPPEEPRSGWVSALDDRSGQINWQYHTPAPVTAGVTPTAGGVVFTGDLAGNFFVFDARTGKVLRKLKFDSGLAGGVITYAVDGKQYVAATVGNIGRLTFGGGGTPTVVVMTTGLPADYVEKSLVVDQPEAAARANDPQHGKKVYTQLCATCHGGQGEGVPGAGVPIRNEAERKNYAQVVEWIKNPQPPMPKLYPAPLSDNDVKAIATYLETLK